MFVKIKEKGVKLAGKWRYKDEEVEIDELEYEANKDYVDIIKEDEPEQTLPQIPVENDKDEEDIELQELKTKAKELGINKYYLMKKEELEKAIEEKVAPMFGEKPKKSRKKKNPQD